MILKRIVLLLSLLILIVACNDEKECVKEVVYLKGDKEDCLKNRESENYKRIDSVGQHWNNEYMSARFFLDRYFDLRDSGFSLDDEMVLIHQEKDDFILYSKNPQKNLGWSTVCKSLNRISIEQMAEISRLESEIVKNHPEDSITSVHPKFMFRWYDRSKREELARTSWMNVYVNIHHHVETDSLEKALLRYLNESVFANCKKN